MNPPARPMLCEAAWLLGTGALALALAWALTGGPGRTLDVQLHNTYFVVGFGYRAALLTWLLALLCTGLRVLAQGGRQRATTITLVALVSGTLLLVLGLPLAYWLLTRHIVLPTS